MDLFIRGGTIVDGANTLIFNGNIGIQNGKMALVQPGTEPSHIENASQVIEATGLIVTPGFIDAHTHSDMVFFHEPRPDMKLRQGVTTEISGNCGSTAAPANEKNLHLLDPFAIETVETIGTYNNFAGYLEKVQKHGLINNQAVLVGHKAIRTMVMGMQARKANPDELSAMKDLLAESLDQGGLGLSSGLFYPPMCFADTNELIELCRVTAGRGKIFACHIRNYSSEVFQAVGEMLEVAEKSGVAVQISHIMVAGRSNWGKSDQLLATIDHARQKGLDVSFDQYPYRAAVPGLLALLPPWMHEGGVDCTIERFNDSKLREKARKDIINGLPGWENVSHQAGWENLVVLSNKIGDMSNSSIQAIADHQQLDPPSVVFSILLKDPYCNLIAHWVDEEDVISFMQPNCQMWGSDSAEPGPLAHPRTYGAYPKILREYVFEKHVLSLERAIHKMTLLPAKRFGLKNRGMIKKGWAADLTIFDPQTIAARSTFEHPDQYPEGIKYVIVNGKLAVKGGKTNLANYGIVLS